ncbi:MAG: acetyl-CoA carboxylase biotin carboxylase subunit [Candidatus Eremiobacteraeota bacterium]|nr:acetyl-CoA carboxylase biotin carboxylase subunit [Candidatus Eremiobacteraeota bacterium]
MFHKVLIANRGEIALRINRACQELGVATVAIYSEADRDSLHVRQADEAFCVGPGPAGRSYLNIPNIISTALVTQCDAIHPGYGFLAENARFAEICNDHGLTFIGPKPSVIALMGDKATAKTVVREAGVATTPGSDVLNSVDEAREAAAAIGYPLLLKATAGGGGRGMRVVESDGDLPRAYAGATAEAEASFKDGRVYLERLIREPRHVEVQVLGDEFGNVVHLGERDCSVQKPAHQKIVEETPAPNLAAPVRDALHEMALRAARYVGYTNAGTLEFLVSGGSVYFMEMNTRIQVEHPVTEMVYNIDLVKEQIRVAAGEPLGYSQGDLAERGHAIECRINAEDPRKNFAPAAGTVSKVVFPGGPGIRVDTHLYAGASIPPYYDSMIAKIVAFGDSREVAIARMERALRETLVEGVPTTIELCLEILATPAFRGGRYDIEFLPNLIRSNGVAKAAPHAP